ncbi:MAG: hypothetical protein HZB85_08245 [Deltaproteobacteria bacterium]|nr:hypothetical protein [Deltaproteobacteria bacterium]
MNKHLPKHEFTLIADDIRFEIGNKNSLMGVYENDIIFPSLPAELPQLRFFTRLSGGKGDYHFRVSLKNSNGVEQFVGGNETTMTLNGSLHINHGVFPFKVSQEGAYTYTIFIDGKEFCRTVFNVKKAQAS